MSETFCFSSIPWIALHSHSLGFAPALEDPSLACVCLLEFSPKASHGHYTNLMQKISVSFLLALAMLQYFCAVKRGVS